MLIDFADVHAKYLIGRSERGRWVFQHVNPSNPLAGRHLASSQIFSNGALGVAVYLRNDIADDGQAVGVFSGLKLSFSHKENGRYLLNNDPARLSVTLDVEAVRHLYTWLQGRREKFRHEIVRHGAPPKTIFGFCMRGGQFTHTLRLTGTLPNERPMSIDVGLSYGDLFTLSMYCVGYVRLLYPSIEGSLIDKLLVIPQAEDERANDAGAEKLQHAEAPSSGQAVSQSPANHVPHPTAPPGVPIETRDDSPPSDALIKAQRAIFAVGINKWPNHSREAIEYIQSTATLDAMDRLIKAGNRGDFTEWDRLASFCSAGA